MRVRLAQALSLGRAIRDRSSLSRYSSTLSRRFWLRATVAASRSAAGSSDLPSSLIAFPIKSSACLASPSDSQHWARVKVARSAGKAFRAASTAALA